MPIANTAQAYDEIFTLVAGALTEFESDGGEIVWQDDLESIDTDTPVIGVSLQHVLGRQASLACGDGSRKWANEGLIHMRLRVPARDDGLTTLNNLVSVCVSAIRGRSTPGGVWFRNVIGREQPPKDGNSQAVVSGEFYYQEIG